MSGNSPVNKTYADYKGLESSNLTMSEYLTDSNILCSKKSYGKKKNYMNVSISNKNCGSFSETVSGQLKNNSTSFISNYSKELYAEENFESVTSIISNYSENSNIQKANVINSEFSLFNDEDTDYYFSASTDSPDHDSFPSTPEKSSSGTDYQRTRKNLKNRLSYQQYSSEEASESMSHEENSNSLNESKFTSNFIHYKKASSFTKQNSLVSVDNQVEHRENDIKASNAYVKKPPSNPVLFQTSNQAEKISGTKTTLENPSKKSSNVLSILDLVSRFTASSNQASQKTNPCNKRKRIQKECESVPAKKASIVNHNVSSKVNSVEKKTTNSTISIKNYSKGAILKSDTIATVGFQDMLKTNGAKNVPSEAPKHYAAKKVKSESLDATKGSVDTLRVNNQCVSKKCDIKTPSKAELKGNNRSVDSTERHIQMLQKYVSKNKTVKDYSRAKSKQPPLSSPATADLLGVKKETAEKKQSDDDKKQIVKFPFVQSKECIVQNQALNNIPEKRVVSNIGILMPTIIAPIPPTSEENSMAPLCLWSLPSIANNSILSDNHYVSCGNFKDLSVPGPSTLNNQDSSVKANDYYMKNLHTEETTTTTTVMNQAGGCNQQKRFFRPRTHITDGIVLHQYMSNSFKKYENNSTLKSKEESRKFFATDHPFQNVTVKEFFDTPSVTDVLLDYVNGLDMDKPLDVPSLNKGYDFPENFENENLMRVIKDFMHTCLSHLTPPKAQRPIRISYAQIIKAAMHKMSSREFIVIMQVFKKSNQLFALKEVCARLYLVAVYVIFDEYRKQSRKYR